MKILHLFGPVNLPCNPDSDPCSGVVWNTLQLAAAQRRQGHDVTICAPAPSSSATIWNGVKLLGLPPKTWARVKLGKKPWDMSQPIANLLYTSTRRFDVIHAHKQEYVRGLRARVKIIHADSDPLSPDTQGAKTRDRQANFHTLNRSADGIIAVSQFVADRFYQAYPFTIPIRVISNGVDTAKFSTIGDETDRQLLRSQWHVTSPDDPVFLFCGALIEEKGVLNLVEAFVHLLASIPNAHLVIVGSENLWTTARFDIADYTARVRQAAMIATKPSPVHFLGAIGHDRLPRIYQAADVVVIPSTCQEASPLVALEAMAASRPVIGTSVGGVPELLQGIGTLIPPGDSDSLCHAMEFLVQHPDVRLRQSILGRQRSLHNTWDHMESAVNQVYRNLLGPDRLSRASV